MGKSFEMKAATGVLAGRKKQKLSGSQRRKNRGLRSVDARGRRGGLSAHQR